MLKAGALIYAIFISFLIALTSSSVIFLSFANRSQTDRSFASDRLITNAESGMQLLMSKQNLVPNDIPKTMDLYGKGMDSVRLEKKSWGLFDIGLSDAFFRGTKVEKIALIGSSANKEDSLSLYLTDMDKPLSLCGETVIKGNCYIPKAGFKRAYIEGKNFLGAEYTKGRVLHSEKTLPALDKDLLKRIQSLGEKTFTPADSVVDIRFLLAHDSTSRSFSKPTYYYVAKGPLVLDNKVLQGNLVVLSSRQITIKANCQISGILVYAPKIIIEEGFSGNLQAFASDSMSIGKKCVLTYPSVLGICRTKTSKDNMLLKLGEEVTCLGILYAGQEAADPKKRVDLIMSKNDVVFGQVYCTGSLDLKGAVYGSVFCSKFTLHTTSSVYENHLLDATIDITRLPSEYGGIVIKQECGSEHKCIVKWLE